MKKYFYLIIILSFLSLDRQAFTASQSERHPKNLEVHSRGLIELISRNSHLKKFHLLEQPDNRFNPFQPRISTEVANKDAAIEVKGQRQFSEKNFNSIRLLGIIKSKSKKWALISRGGTGLVHASVGEIVSKNKVKIIAIKDNYIRFEKKKYFAGKWFRKTKDIYLIRTH